MTCEQLRSIVSVKSVHEATLAEWSAIIIHFGQCQDCVDWNDANWNDARGSVLPMSKETIAAIRELEQRASRDPETMEMFAKAGPVTTSHKVPFQVK